VLQISKDTVCSVLKKNAKNEPLLFNKQRIWCSFTVRGRNTFECRSWRILEFCSEQGESTLDLVCHRKRVGNHIGLAQWETSRSWFFGTLGVIKTISDTQIAHGYLEFLFKIYSAKQTLNRKRQNVKDRAEKLEL
jgi:hypothetical protein